MGIYYIKDTFIWNSREYMTISEINLSNKNLIDTISLRGDWRDQGFGNRKGRIRFVLKNNSQLIDTIDYNQISPHMSNGLNFIYTNKDDKIFDELLVQIFVGAAGGHELHIDAELKISNMKEYIPTNNVDKYMLAVTKTTPKHMRLLMRNIPYSPYSIQIDDFLYKYLYNVQGNVYKHIHDIGIKNGYIYTIRQLKHHFGIQNIYKKDNKLFCKIENHYVELGLVVKSLQEKNFEYFINDINLIEDKTVNIQKDIIVCFIGNYEIGTKLLNKIANSSKNNLPIVLIFRNNEIYERTTKLVQLFKNRIVFISKEYGNDIIPTLQAINYMLSKYNIQNIYKFHTKSDEKWFNECTDYLLNNKMSYNSKSNCTGHPNYYLDINYERYHCKAIINKNKSIIDKKVFVRGTIFYTKVETFSSILNHMKTDYLQYFINNCYDTNAVLLDNSPSHFLERLFGLIKVSNKINYEIVKENKICIFHCGDIGIFDYIIEKYPVIRENKMIITYYHDDYYDKLINNTEINIIHLLKVENKGCDIGPFLLSVKYLLNNSHLYNDTTLFLKLHTKNIKKKKYWTETLIKDIIKCNLPKSDKPLLLGSNEYIHSQNKAVNFQYMKNIYNRNIKKKIYFDLYFDTYYIEFTKSHFKNPYTELIFSEEFYKYCEPDLRHLSNKGLNLHWNNHGKTEFHRKSNINYIKKWSLKENYFVAGTIFGFNKPFLTSFKNFDLDYEYSILEDGYVTNDNATKVHAWEYYFGFYTIYNNGAILGYNNNILQNTYKNKDKDIIPLFAIINRSYSEAKIAFFMILPGDNPDSGGYRTLLKYIKLLNDNNLTIDIYFGICWNNKDVDMNVNELNEYGIPNCSNWFNSSSNQINHFINNINKYNVIDIKKNNYYIGFKCQRNYEIIVANAWQTAEAVYQNKHLAKKIYYIIQDREDLFYPNKKKLQNSVLKTYKKEFNYFCITQYLSNYFIKKNNFNSICGSHMCVNINIYKNLNESRHNSVIIPYYKDIKPGRKPNLVRKIIDILSSNGIICYIYPFDYVKKNENIKNLGTMNESELNILYNKYKVGIIFSDTNPSRLGFEMYASGLQVIEYDSEFTKYDMPEKYFTKIKNEKNILDIVVKLFNKPYDGSFINNIDMNYDYDTFLSFFKKNL